MPKKITRQPDNQHGGKPRNPKVFRLLERLGTNPKVYYMTEREWVRRMGDNYQDEGNQA